MKTQNRMCITLDALDLVSDCPMDQAHVEGQLSFRMPQSGPVIIRKFSKAKRNGRIGVSIDQLPGDLSVGYVCIKLPSAAPNALEQIVLIVGFPTGACNKSWRFRCPITHTLECRLYFDSDRHRFVSRRMVGSKKRQSKSRMQDVIRCLDAIVELPSALFEDDSSSADLNADEVRYYSNISYSSATAAYFAFEGLSKPFISAEGWLHVAPKEIEKQKSKRRALYSSRAFKQILSLNKRVIPGSVNQRNVFRSSL